MPAGQIYQRTGIQNPTTLEWITGGDVGTPEAAAWTQYQNVVGAAYGEGVYGIDELANLDWYAVGKIADIFGAPGSVVVDQLVEGDLPLPPPPQTQLKETVMAIWDDEQGNFGDFGVDDAWSVAQDIWSGAQNIRTALLTDDSGGNVSSGGGGEMVPVGLGGAVAAGGIWLGTLLARALGRGAGSAVFAAANGVRVRIAQLWPLVRRYGAQNVAGALGITVGALGTMLMQPGAQTGRIGRKRGRGISARDVKTTRRTIKQLRSLTRMAGIQGGGGGYRRSYYKPRRRSRGYYC